MDPLTEFYLALAGQGLSGKPGAQLNTGDMSSIFSKNLGMLTGTLTDTNLTDDDIYNSYAPDIARQRSNPDSDKIATEIVEQLGSGMSMPQVLKNLRSKDLDKQDLADYKEYATNVAKQMGDVSREMSKRTTPASEAGLPEPDAQFDPASKMGGIYALLNEKMQPLTRSVGKKYKDLSKDQQKQYGKNNKSTTGDILKSLLTFKNTDQVTYDRQNAPLKEEKYVAADLARGEIAASQAAQIKEALATGMQRNSLAGSPFMDELFKRTIMKRLIENPGAISKLQNPKG